MRPVKETRKGGLRPFIETYFGGKEWEKYEPRASSYCVCSHEKALVLDLLMHDRKDIQVWFEPRKCGHIHPQIYGCRHLPAFKARMGPRFSLRARKDSLDISPDRE